MAIVEMSKLKLIGLAHEKENILNALHKTGLVELRTPSEEDNTFLISDGAHKDEVKEKLEKIDQSIDFISEQALRAKKQNSALKFDGENDFTVKYEEFVGITQKSAALDQIVSQTECFKARLGENKTRRAKLQNLKAQLEPYNIVKDKFSEFADTEHTACFFGTVPEDALSALNEFAAGEELASLTVYAKSATSVVLLVAMKEIADKASQKLAEVGFSRCPFTDGETAEEKLRAIAAEQKKINDEENEIFHDAAMLSVDLRDLKIYSDYCKFQYEKIAASEKFRCTAKTFTLEGYLPKESIETVHTAIIDASDAVFTEFSDPTDEDTPPTLMKNNKIISQAEFITDMYSVPDYREYDPNGFVFVFFMLFFGLIMADIGYGILLFVGGMIMRSRMKEGGSKKLVTIITYGGIFTIVFGILFGSFFGFSTVFGLKLPKILPDPTLDPAHGGRINVLIILLSCLALGLVHMSFGYVLKMINEIRKKDYAGAIFEALVWILFNIGLFCAVFNFLTGYFEIPTSERLYSLFDTLQMPGLILAGVSLLIAALTAGRKEKGFGKISKGFGAVYGIINLFADILSYARLFGLLLSGMIIAQQFNNLGIGLINGGGIGYVLGVIVIVIGHAFNLAMGVLGAYIHNCRLQYIEFFSKFYTGDGEAFAPIGSDLTYIRLAK